MSTAPGVGRSNLGGSHAPSSTTVGIRKGVARAGDARPTKEKGILFKAEMVRAILAGAKSQTRRIVNPQPPSPEAVRKLAGDDYHWMNCTDNGLPLMWRPVGPVWAVRELGAPMLLRCPYGQPGDRLWVRETFRGHGGGITSKGCELGLAYAAGGFRASKDSLVSVDDYNRYIGDSDGRWRPSLLMPRWASRLTLEVTEVRVERLQSITEDDARAEGVETGKMQPAIVNGERGSVMIFDQRKAFAVLWDSINGKKAPWSSNPWLWCVSFRRLA